MGKTSVGGGMEDGTRADQLPCVCGGRVAVQPGNELVVRIDHAAGDVQVAAECRRLHSTDRSDQRSDRAPLVRARIVAL